MIWSVASLKTLHPSPVWTAPLSRWSKCHTTPQRVRLTASSKSSVSLHESFAQIRRIPPSNIFAVLTIRYIKHRIDQKNSDMLRHNSVQTTEQARGTLLPLSTFIACLLIVWATEQARRISTFWYFYGLLYKLPNKPNGLPLTLLRLAVWATKQARQTSTFWHFYDLLDCKTPNRSDGLPLSDTWQLYHLQSAWVG